MRPARYFSIIQLSNARAGESAAESDGKKTVWRCKICGYEYVGEELPEDYICPVCKHPASDFEKVVG